MHRRSGDEELPQLDALRVVLQLLAPLLNRVQGVRVGAYMAAIGVGGGDSFSGR